MKRMLFNATHPEEIRVALVDGQRLLDLDIESTSSNLKKGNIYKAKVTRVEPSLEAAFVDYGSERQGFLPLKEVSRQYFNEDAQNKSIHKVSITDALQEGQEILVQIDKEERGNKGAALTTFISLAGRFIVLMPNNPKGGGISRRIAGEEREIMREILNNLDVPKDHSVILRTAGMGRSEEEIKWDADFLTKLWHAIEDSVDSESAPKLIYQDSSVVVRALRDYLRDDTKEVIIDDSQVYERALKFVNLVMPERNTRIKYYEDTVPLLARYQVEQQIEAAFSREVRLPSGGAIVIDHTEAVVTVDVNSAKSTKGGDIEETALHTNLEAAEEIASQLKIRDIGGLIVIDFIDMQASKNQRKVEQTLSSLVKKDRARIQIGKISKFGLLEMSRQRIRGALLESNYHTCPRCKGNGVIRGVVSSALSILRIIEEEALKENTEAVLVHLPVESATYLLNEKRYDLALMERRLATRITLVPNSLLETPHFKIERLRGDEYGQIANIPSHRIELDDGSITEANSVRAVVLENAAVQMDEVTQSMEPAPVNSQRSVRSNRNNKNQHRNQKSGKSDKSQKDKQTPTENNAHSLNNTGEGKGVLGFVSRLFGGSKKEAPNEAAENQKTTSQNENDSADGQPNQQKQRSHRNSRGGQRNQRGGQRRNNNRQGSNQERSGNQQRNNRRRKPHKQPERTNEGNTQQQASAEHPQNAQKQASNESNNTTTNRNRRAHQQRTQRRRNAHKNDGTDENVNNTTTADNQEPAANDTSHASRTAEAKGDSATPSKPKTRRTPKKDSANENADSDQKPKSTRGRKPKADANGEEPKVKPSRTRKATSSKAEGAATPGTDTEEKPKRTRKASASKKSESTEPAKKTRAPRKKAESTSDADKESNTKKAPAKRRSAKSSAKNTDVGDKA